MRSLSSALNAAYGNTVAIPAWLLEMTMASTYRYSSHGTVTWNSLTWTAADFSISSIRVGALTVSGELVLGNADDAAGALALGEGFTDKRIRIWGYDASIASPAVGDPVLVCDAVGAGAEVAVDHVRVGLRDFCHYRLGPRAVVTNAFGFTTLLGAGRVIQINGIPYKIGPAR